MIARHSILAGLGYGARVTLLAGLVAPGVALACEDDDVQAERQALARALRLAPLPPGVRAVLIEPDLAPDPRPLRNLDAFVVRNPDGGLRPIVYINRHSTIVRQAAAGSVWHVLQLAAVLHHEAQHLAGATEEEARRAERALLDALVARHSAERGGAKSGAPHDMPRECQP